MSDSSNPMRLSSFVDAIVSGKISGLVSSFNGIVNRLRDQYTKLTKLKTFQNRFARGSNPHGNWELRPGIIEMWGRYHGTPDREASQSFGFPLVLPNTTYSLTATPIVDSANAAKDLSLQLIGSSRQNSSAAIYYQSTTADATQKLDGFEWRVICVVPFDYTLNENTTAPVTGHGDESGTVRVAVSSSRSEA